MGDALPLLLPPSAIPRASTSGWQPKQHLSLPQPPAPDEQKQDLTAAVAKQLLDGKLLKKNRPRRTVDYGGSMGRWITNRKSRPNPSYVPYIRPAPPYIVDLLPPLAYPYNPSTSLTTKFIHTSTNKIRCPVNCVTWTPEGRRVLTGSTSGEFTLWNGLTFNFETILQAHDTAIRTLTFTRSGAYLVSADQTGIIKYFQPNMNNLTAWNGHREAVRGISFAPDDSRFATASDDSTVRIWDFGESREERVLSGHGWDVRCVQWHPSKGLLVSGSKDNLVKFWDPRSGTCLSTLHQHKNTIQAIEWSPDGDLVATASRDQTVRVFDIRAMKEYRVFKGHKKEVCSVAWHPIHPILVSGGSEGSLLYWDVAAPEPLPGSTVAALVPPGPRATLSQAHDSNVWALAFHPLGHLLVSASNDHTTRFWARERPGDASSNFSGGGEKPPTALDGGDGGEGDDDDDMAVPGFSYAGTSGAPPGLGQWWSKEEEQLPGLGRTLGGGMGGTVASAIPPDSSLNQNGQMETDTSADEIIPGFGRANAPIDGQRMQTTSSTGFAHHPNQNMQQDAHGDNDWNHRGYGGGRDSARPSRWAPRRGGRY